MCACKFLFWGSSAVLMFVEFFAYDYAQRNIFLVFVAFLHVETKIGMDLGKDAHSKRVNCTLYIKCAKFSLI